MTFTSDERREVAQKLREKKKEFFGERSWFPQDLILYQSMYLTAIDECLPDGECGFDVLGRPNGCAHADRQKDWMRYRVWMGLERCPSWWLDQKRFERA